MNPPAALSISRIRIDGSTQARVNLDKEAVAEYAEAIAQGAAMPPVVVFFDGTDHWMGDGFHRSFAHKKAGRESILADIREGTRRDAVLYAVGANSEHGLRRTNADKRKAVTIMLGDEEWSQLSEREIARQCRVTHTFVQKLRHERTEPQKDKVATVATPAKSTETKKTESGGTPKATENAEQKEHSDALAMTADEQVKMLKDLNRENAELLDRLKQLESSDLGAEVAKERAQRKSAERSQGEAMDRARDFQRELERFGKWFAELRKITGCDSNTDAVRAVRAWASQRAPDASLDESVSLTKQRQNQVSAVQQRELVALVNRVLADSPMEERDEAIRVGLRDIAAALESFRLLAAKAIKPANMPMIDGGPA